MQPYSLTTLYEARLAAVDEAQRVAAQRRADYARADAQSRDAEVRVAEFRARMQAEAQSQLCRAREGRAIVADLQMSAAFRAAAENELNELTVALKRAQAAAAECQRWLDQAQHQLEIATQELAIVERHRQNFLAEERRTAEAKTEEDAAEIWQAHQSTVPRERSK